MAYSKKDIDRFFEGKYSKQEAKRFLIWLNSDEGEKAYKSMIEDAWTNTTAETEVLTEKEDPHVIFLSNQNHSDINLLNQKGKTSRTKRLGIAASLLLVAAMSFIFYNYDTNQPTEIPLLSEELTEIVRSTARGNKKLIKLPDGSLVTLNAESNIAYNSDFVENRMIRLEGEGFFEVVEDVAHPFTVITENISTTALGTSFNIKAYKGKADIQITLATGKVLIKNEIDNGKIEILPGEAIFYQENLNILQKENVDLRQALSWKEGILHFEQRPFDEILEELERWYGVDFQVEGKAKIPQYKCNGTFKPHEYLSNVLEVLSYSVEFEYTIKGDKVILNFN